MTGAQASSLANVLATETVALQSKTDDRSNGVRPAIIAIFGVGEKDQEMLFADVDENRKNRTINCSAERKVKEFNAN